MQVTLDDQQYERLVVESKRSGASIAELVRQAVASRYRLESAEERATRFRDALNRASGIWHDRREDGQTYQERLRRTLRVRPPVNLSGDR